MRLPGIGLLLCLGTIGSPDVPAGTVRDSEVSHEAGVYRVRMAVEVAAGFEAVRGVITDYANLDRVSPMIKHSTLLDDPGEPRRELQLEFCVLFFCFQPRMVERVQEHGSEMVVTTVIPEHSDFRSGQTRWQIRALEPGRTLIRFDTTVAPDFWIPPLIGPLMLAHKLQREAQLTIENIEVLARE